MGSSINYIGKKLTVVSKPDDPILLEDVLAFVERVKISIGDDKFDEK